MVSRRPSVDLTRREVVRRSLPARCTIRQPLALESCAQGCHDHNLTTISDVSLLNIQKIWPEYYQHPANHSIAATITHQHSLGWKARRGRRSDHVQTRDLSHLRLKQPLVLPAHRAYPGHKSGRLYIP